MNKARSRTSRKGSAGPATPPAPPYVLLVDDDEDVLHACREALARAEPSWSLISFSTATQALGWTPDGGEPRLAVLDLHLPDGSGIEIASRLRASLPLMRIILFTDSTKSHDRAAGLGAGANEFVTKPLRVQDIADRFVAMCRQRHPMTA